jgi:monoamine oxidase
MAPGFEATVLARFVLTLPLEAATALASRKSSETQMQASRLVLQRLAQRLLVSVSRMFWEGHPVVAWIRI